MGAKLKPEDYGLPQLGKKQSRTEDALNVLDKALCELSENITTLQGKIQIALLPEVQTPVCENEKVDIQRTELEMMILNLTSRVENMAD